MDDAAGGKSKSLRFMIKIGTMTPKNPDAGRKAVEASLAKTRKVVAQVTEGTKRLEKVAKASARRPSN